MDQNDNNNFWDQPMPTGHQPTTTASPAMPQPSQQEPNNQTDEELLKNLSDEEVIDLFIRGIMQEKGTDTGSEETQNQIFNELKTELLKQIDRSLIAELPDDKLEEFNKIATEKGQIDPNMLAQAVIDANINSEQITVSTMQKFRELYLGNEGKTEGAQ